MPEAIYDMGWADWLRLFTFTYNGRPNDTLGNTWFVSTIMQLYIIAPVIYHLLLKRISPKWIGLSMGGLVILGFVARQFLLWKQADWFIWVYTFSPMQWDIFFVPFMLHARPDIMTSLSGNVQKYAREISLILFAAVLGWGWYNWYHLVNVSSYIYCAPTLITITLVFIGIAYGSTLKSHGSSLHLQLTYLWHHPWHLIEAFAVITYSFYLYHQFILHVFPKIFAEHPVSPTVYLWGSIGGGFVLSVIWCVVMYLSIERPLNNWRYQRYTVTQ
mgnify:CR=1 FL=1